MRRELTWMFAAMLATSVTLGGCGGAKEPAEVTEVEQTAAAEGEAANPDEQVEEANPVDKFVGSWKFAYTESDGVKIGGDFEALAEMIGEDVDIALTINEDGTATMKMSDDSDDLTWELADDGTLSAKATEDDGPKNITMEFVDGELVAKGMLEEDESEQSAETLVVFTTDGKSTLFSVPNVAEATEIKDASVLVGDWSLSGMSMMSLYMEGEADKVANMFGDVSISASFADDGTCVFFDESSTYDVSADGATVTISGTEVPVKLLGDDIVVDLSESMGELFGSGTDFFFVYSKV